MKNPELKLEKLKEISNNYGVQFDFSKYPKYISIVHKNNIDK